MTTKRTVTICGGPVNVQITNRGDRYECALDRLLNRADATPADLDQVGCGDTDSDAVADYMRRVQRAADRHMAGLDG